MGPCLKSALPCFVTGIFGVTGCLFVTVIFCVLFWILLTGGISFGFGFGFVYHIVKSLRLGNPSTNFLVVLVAEKKMSTWTGLG